jgi:hypothetical protein
MVAAYTDQGQQCLSERLKSMPIFGESLKYFGESLKKLLHNVSSFADTVIGAVAQEAAGFGHEGSLYLD